MRAMISDRSPPAAAFPTSVSGDRDSADPAAMRKPEGVSEELVRITSRREVINYRYFVSVFYKFIGKVASNEACTARD